MSSCYGCGKWLILPRYWTENGNDLCANCYNELESRKPHLVRNLLGNLETKNVMKNFIEKYGDKYNEEDFDRLKRLLGKKYKIQMGDYILEEVIDKISDLLEEEKELNKFERDLKYHKTKTFYCSICKDIITRGEFNYSIDKFDRALCKRHQKEQLATIHAKKLYNALKTRGVNCVLESQDGHKSVDIAIHEARLYLEIDGTHHITNPNQFLTDLKRDQHSQSNGYLTKRISNDMINKHLEEIADSLKVVVKNRVDELKS